MSLKEEYIKIYAKNDKSNQRNLRWKFLRQDGKIFLVDRNENIVAQLNYILKWKTFKKYGKYINIYDYIKDTFEKMISKRYNLNGDVFKELINVIIFSLKTETNVTTGDCFSAYLTMLYNKDGVDEIDIKIFKILLEEFYFLN